MIWDNVNKIKTFLEHIKLTSSVCPGKVVWILSVLTALFSQSISPCVPGGCIEMPVTVKV